ncbi:MAG TPA: FAD-dependent oxidoreductase [Treponemataceae bacterium]|nr:FAD-dependent oxidoreductase [Treponemataceae bacterium]
METQFDTVIIGKGPAGITAALYLKRAKHSVVVIGKDYGALGKAEKIENYYGLEKPVSGEELARIGISQAENLGIPVLSAEVTSLEAAYGQEPYRFTVTIKEPDKKTDILAKSVLIATGKQRTGLKVPGFEEFKGKGISFCAVCDGFFYKNKAVAVIGNGAYAVSELEHLYNLTKNITLFTNGLPLEGEVPDGVRVVKGKIVKVAGEQTVSGIEAVSDSGTATELFPVQGIFAALGTAGASDFAAKLGLETGTGADSSTLITDKDMKTNFPGIYAAGDAAGGFLQIVKAASDGAIAAKSIGAELKELK